MKRHTKDETKERKKKHKNHGNKWVFNCRWNKGKDCNSRRETGSSFQKWAAAIVNLKSPAHLKDLKPPVGSDLKWTADVAYIFDGINVLEMRHGSYKKI